MSPAAPGSPTGGSTTPGSVTRRAHAKLNVFLRVLSRRDDGLHDIETVVMPITLHDVVTVEPGEPSLHMELHGGIEPYEPLEVLTNAASVAAERFRVAAFRGLDDRPMPRIRLDKWIPFSAGLGGGSADAAATLLALNDLWARGWSRDELAALGAELGSDIPALLAGQPVLASGRGEVLTPVFAASTWWVLKPFGFGVSAADAYEWWDSERVTGPDPGVLIAALESGGLELLGDALFNDLQAGVVARHPEVGEAIEAFLEAGALGAIVSGSGPTVAALARHVGHADTLAGAMPGSIVVGGPPDRDGP